MEKGVGLAKGFLPNKFENVLWHVERVFYVSPVDAGVVVGGASGSAIPRVSEPPDVHNDGVIESYALKDGGEVDMERVDEDAFMERGLLLLSLHRSRPWVYVPPPWVALASEQL